eukprot:6212672-Pleurochrysis_carterae.AAC.9
MLALLVVVRLLATGKPALVLGIARNTHDCDGTNPGQKDDQPLRSTRGAIGQGPTEPSEATKILCARPPDAVLAHYQGSLRPPGLLRAAAALASTATAATRPMTMMDRAAVASTNDETFQIMLNLKISSSVKMLENLAI